MTGIDMQSTNTTNTTNTSNTTNTPNTTANKYLLLAALSSGVAALAHLGCILFGGDWYRFLGAGEQMAVMAEQGHWYPATVTSVIALMLALWSLYALSGARLIGRLPWLKLGLCVIASIYLIRALGFALIMPLFPGNSLTFWLASSGSCFIIGLLYTIGTAQVWSGLSAEAKT